MKLLITGDWHLGANQFGVIQGDGRNSRLVDIEDTIHRMVDLSVDSNVNVFICAGDIFHTNKPTVEEQLAFYRIVKHLDESSIDYIRFIIGNHDYNSKLGCSHALKLFQHLVDNKRFRIYDKTKLERITLNGENLYLVHYPYRADEPDWESIKQARSKFTATDRIALICHSHLEGAVVGCEPFEIKDDSTTKFRDLPVDFVFAGHFHKPQILSKSSPLAFYPGSPQPIDFNERNDAKGAVLVETSDSSYMAVGLKSRRLYQIDLEDTVDIEDWHREVVFDSIVKVNVVLSESRQDSFDESAIRKKLNEWGCHSVASINLRIVRDKVARDPEVKLDNDMTFSFEKYCASREFGELHNVVLETGKRIISSVGIGN